MLYTGAAVTLPSPDAPHFMTRLSLLLTPALLSATLMMPPAVAADAAGDDASRVQPMQLAAATAATETSKKKHRHAKRAQAPAAHDEEAEFANFTQWRAVGEFINEMSEQHGFDKAALTGQFQRIQYREQVVRLINPPPASKAKNWSAYRDRFIEPKRLSAGVAFWNEHERALQRAEAEFGVPAEIIIGILGVETLYGRMTGKFPVLDALATLAFAYPDTPNREARMAYFRGELKQALLYARENRIDPMELKGSFAGAIGWPQFMPGSIRRFAVDFDGDGRIDLRNSPVDAIGSIASFLSQHGWTAGQPVVFPASVTPDADWPGMLGQGLKASYSRDQLEQAGVVVPPGAPTSVSYGLVDLQDGERPPQYWLGTANFFAITHYNRSYYYAMAVVELGRAVSRQRTQ